MAAASNTTMRSLVDALEKCEINTWAEVKLVMMLSVLSYDRLQNVHVLRDLELIKRYIISKDHIKTQLR